ncbi:FUSC family protein [Cellulomonas sp. P22]|uniref:FUSC family protein n=1 Tax=Cellulomonas sp. P22 TaxID=3373189 RepID=UPI00378AF402
MPFADHLPHPRDLVRFGPPAASNAVALRAGVSVAVPLATLMLTGHLEWAAYAAFGAFTALYGRIEGYRRRLPTQLAAAAVLVAATGGGALLAATSPSNAAGTWPIVLAAAATAVVASLIGDAAGWHPVGPLFAVFAIATCAAIPTDSGGVVASFVVSAATAAFAVGVGALGALSRRRRAVHHPARLPFGARRVVDDPQVLRHAVRYGLAALVAGSVANVIGIGHPGWAMVAAIASLVGPDTPGRVLRGLHRVAGTAVGLVIAAALLSLHLDGWAVVATVVVLQTVTELFVGRNYGFAMIFITPMALLMTTMVTVTPTDVLVRDRGVETFVGAVVGVGLAFLATEHRAAVRTARSTLEA